MCGECNWPMDDYKKVTSINKSKLNGWISIQDEYPEKNGPYLIYRTDRVMEVCEWVDDWWFWVEQNLVTHWMPLPKAPNE